MTHQTRHELAHGALLARRPAMLAGRVSQVVDHPCINHEWLSTTTGYIHVPAEHIERAWRQANERVTARLGVTEG